MDKCKKCNGTGRYYCSVLCVEQKCYKCDGGPYKYVDKETLKEFTYRMLQEGYFLHNGKYNKLRRNNEENN